MRLNKYLINESTGNTSLTTFFHEICTAIFIKDNNAKIETGQDIIPYFENGDIIAVNSSLTKVDMDILLKKYKKQFNSTGKSNIIADAKKLAQGIVKTIGKPKGAVWWTGPTNDGSRLGAADIFYVSKKGEETPISLKFGAGQLKNMGLKNIGDTLLKGVLKPGQDLIKILDNDEYKQYWDGMTNDWMKFLFTLSAENNDGFSEILGKYLNINWEGYLKLKLNDEEILIAEESLSNILNKKVDIKSKNATLRYIVKKYYEQFGSKGDKEWTQVKMNWFEKLFGSFFDKQEEKINNNLKNVFKVQMSAGEIPMWYAAQGGKKIMYIPSAKNLESISNKLLSFSYKKENTPSGHRIILEVNTKSGSKAVALMKININIRWKDGQMNGKPSSASEMKLFIKDEEWNKIFSPKNTKLI